MTDQFAVFGSSSQRLRYLVLDPAAVVPADAVEIVVDNLELIGRFTAKPTDRTASLVGRTSDRATPLLNRR